MNSTGALGAFYYCTMIQGLPEDNIICTNHSGFWRAVLYAKEYGNTLGCTTTQDMNREKSY